MNQENYEKMNPRIVEEDELTIDLGELFRVLLSKVHIIILAAILMALVAFVGTKLFVTPMYTSVTKMYVLAKDENSTTSSSNYSELTAGSMLTKDYMELVKSRPVLEKTISVLNLKMQPAELANMISVSTPTDTRIMTVSVESANPKQAKEIADAVREAVSVQIKEIMSVDSVNTVEEGNLPTSPSSPNTMKNMMLGGILGFVIAAGIITLIYLLDDTIKTPEDVENYLGLNVLTSIPIQSGAAKSKKTKHQRESRKAVQKRR
ncbi:YveK family protein [Dorea amylophila]|uniref:Capsular polysaccharide type 8 biosynthesis protein cap8A n=2 Tax=Dorea TaxID=189330 RepID=A0A174NGP6_9FIRM|nr:MULTISPECIES: Wzz/FepE/Etk N-terminal domain-containing protein [Dorea]MCU6740861.1 Wzz/FepE/Etk N-terminal domain-containing protein [Dorea amylophila]CUP45209.1 Capsular polysaccharide type 8 biosynthesis protein cap8A [Dorea longicatena]